MSLLSILSSLLSEKMKITNAEIFPLDLKLSEPYTIAYETVESSTNVILKLTTDTGLTGWGCAAPEAHVTKESAERVQRVFNKAIEPRLLGESPFHFARLHERLKELLPDCPNARAMTDIALYDLMAQQAKVPLYQLLGGYRDSMPTSVTIGILPLEETLSLAKQWVKTGFSILKIKGGLDVEADIERMLRLREKFGPEIGLRFDANQGYSVEQAIHFVQKTAPARVEILEQPTPAAKEKKLGKVAANVHIPVMADESMTSLADMHRLINENLTDMVNIKLMKVGGITEAMHINSVAKAAGVEAMVGCMDECGLGITAGLHFALARPNIIYADLDGHLDLLDDPFHKLVKIKDGVLYPKKKAGLGVPKGLDI